jgi:hypothetical protein
MQGAMKQVAAELQKVGALLGESLKVQQQTVQAIQAPRTSNIENLQMVDGKVVGATVKSTPATMQ